MGRAMVAENQGSLPMSRTFAGPWARFGLVLAIFVLAAGLLQVGSATEVARVIPAPADDEPAGTGGSEVAVLAGGCFWGIQGVFQHVAGVTSAVSGYAGGANDTAHYEMVGSGRTGHAEAVRITFDPKRISYGRILQIYFSVAHDPTQLDRQGPDVGSQYRSAIFPQTAEQARIANAYILQLGYAGVFPAEIVTKIEPGRDFYPAEAYHQDYLTLHPTQPYVAVHDLPKIDNLKRRFPNLYRADPVLVATAQPSR
jgi:peptide-methionine (S)-S-oxide reductase